MDILAQTIEMGPSLVLHQKDVISPLYFHPNSFFLLGVTQKTCKNLHSSRRYQQPIQCPLDIETLDKAAALDLATATPLTDLRQYINSNLGFRDLEI